MTRLDLTERIEIAKIQEKKTEKVKKSLDASVKDAMAYNVMQGTGVNFLSAFAVALKASNFQISVLSSLPQLLSAWIQLFSPKLLEKFKSRKKPISIFVLLQALTWLPLIAIPFIFLGETAVWFVILFYTLFYVFGAIINPLWQSLMGDLVPAEERGAYFGKRTAAAGIITLIITLFAGFYLNLYPERLVFYAFAALFFISFLFRMISRHYLNKMFEPGFVQNSRTKFSFRHFVSRITKTNFGNFALFVGILRIGENIASPFYTVYMLKYLKFDYLTFTLITIAPLIASLLVMTQWGRISDKFGNKKILSVCALMIAFVPLYWMLFKDPVMLFLGEFFISGIFWAGFNLGSGNFIYDTITPEKRTHCVAYFNVFNGTGLFIGAMIGGILATIIPDNSIIFSVGLLWIFLIAFIFRIGVFAVFKNRIKEVRTVPEIKDREIFYDVLVDNKVGGFTIDLITTIATTAKKPIKSLGKDLQAIEKGIQEIDKEVENAIKKTIDTADKIVKRKKSGK